MEIYSEDFKDISISEGKNYLFVVRHAQRADNSNHSYHSDSEITEKGKEQAFRTGEILKDLCSRSSTHKVKIISSPWLRCIMTSSIIANTLGATEICIEPRICESLLVGSFGEHNPLPTLTVRNTDLSEFCKTYIPSSIELIIPEDDKYQEVEQLFPEEIEANYKRYQTFFEEFRTADKGTILIAVSHGLASDALRDYLGAPKTIVDYCSITCAEFDYEDQESKPNCVINLYSNHTGRPEDFQVDKIVGFCVI